LRRRHRPRDRARLGPRGRGGSVSPIARSIAIHSPRIATLTGGLGRRGGRLSPTRACRMFRAGDGWMALNLARPEDRDLVPAWLECEFGGEPWDLIAAHGPKRTTAELCERADL